MTDQPPPGNYPPPPPPQGGYPPPPPPGGGAFSPAAPVPGQALPKDAYTPWLTRVLAYLIDSIPIFILYALAWVFLATMQTVETVCITDDSEFDLGEFCATGNNGPSTLAVILAAICGLAALAYGIWNFGLRQGKTGSSIGKGVLKFKVVGENTGQPIGFGMSIVRQLAHAIDGLICFIGFLFPLWDAKRQTIADKLIKTVCVPT